MKRLGEALYFIDKVPVSQLSHLSLQCTLDGLAVADLQLYYIVVILVAVSAPAGTPDIRAAVW